MRVLDHGEIELIDRMGDDYRILQSARVSTGGVAQKGDKEDRGLIRYLYKNQHLSPFEQVQFTFRVKCPIFVARQWFRHRAASYNEFSNRYSPAIDDVYMPDNFRIQGIKNHQGSGQNVDPELDKQIHKQVSDFYKSSDILYEDLLSKNVSKELARIITPVGNYTEFYFTIDLRNLFHFLELRLHSHAQYEIRVYAEAILQMLKNIPELKWSVEIFQEMNEINYLILECIDKEKDLSKLAAYLKKFIE